MKLPPLEMRQDERTGLPYGVDVLAPGIRASAAHSFGRTTFEGLRLETWVVTAFVLRGDSVASVAQGYELTEQQVLAAVYFEAGRSWERSRARRNRMAQEVKVYWQKIHEAKDRRKP